MLTKIKQSTSTVNILSPNGICGACTVKAALSGAQTCQDFSVKSMLCSYMQVTTGKVLQTFCHHCFEYCGGIQLHFKEIRHVRMFPDDEIETLLDFVASVPYIWTSPVLGEVSPSMLYFEQIAKNLFLKRFC